MIQPLRQAHWRWWLAFALGLPLLLILAILARPPLDGTRPLAAPLDAPLAGETDRSPTDPENR